jgi:hypothetical protein
MTFVVQHLTPLGSSWGSSLNWASRSPYATASEYYCHWASICWNIPSPLCFQTCGALSLSHESSASGLRPSTDGPLDYIQVHLPFFIQQELLLFVPHLFPPTWMTSISPQLLLITRCPHLRALSCLTWDYFWSYYPVSLLSSAYWDSKTARPLIRWVYDSSDGRDRSEWDRAVLE